MVQTKKCSKIDLEEVTMNTSAIKRCEKMKYLGIVLDPQLNFGKHIAYIQSKVIPKIKTLSKIAPIVRQSTSLMIYKTLILPIIEYGDIIYDCLSVKDAATLQKLQNACLKHILHLPRLASTAYIHETLNVEYLSTRRQLHVATQMFRIQNDMAPQYLMDRFISRSEISKVNTRNALR